MSEDNSQALAADRFIDDNNSAVAESVDDSSLACFRSSVLAYHEENGRTYHSMSAGKYFIPNDEQEQDRLDLHHHLMLLTLDDKLALCPKNETAKRVLDLGTGTGIWAINYADAHPETQVIGVDLSPIQPDYVPPNCQFEVDDVEKEWTWSSKFDFIYARNLGGSFADHQSMIQKCFDNLESGGYLEMWDIGLPVTSDDGTLTEQHALSEMSHLTVRAAAALGRPIDNTTRYKNMFEQAGFENVQMRMFKWPSNQWPADKKHKTLGMWNCANIDSGLEGLTLFLFTRGLGMSKEECLAYCAKARKELRDTHIHAYWPMYCCYGKRP
ncbi:S-adenosyl-L-methionine-dependent methyltransferase [Pleurostoma richardsiae]|uniref:S-adenosyl-L-methionine-dependent methyltransferase n=1 Tax=Pleurostoma richardsiae TaxID=41990 RepID=A0AA38RIM3_9PEZI|nr:S-adenosyl-L-methionine-dependent methyltransferase [Pleurostoma richardsiae]